MTLQLVFVPTTCHAYVLFLQAWVVGNLTCKNGGTGGEKLLLMGMPV